MIINTNYIICDWIGDGHDLDELDRATLKAKFNQFQGRLPIAVAELKKIVEPAGIVLDHSVDSLSPLQDWLFQGAKQYGIEHGWPERSDQVGFSRFPTKINRMTVLSPYWKSLISDASIYMGEMFQKKCPELHWEMMYQNHVAKGYPYLTGWPRAAKGTGFPVYIPYRVLLNIARGEDDDERFLVNSFQYYSNLI